MTRSYLLPWTDAFPSGKLLYFAEPTIKMPFPCGCLCPYPKSPERIYGLIFQSFKYYVNLEHGEQTLVSVIKHSGIKTESFLFNETYPTSDLFGLIHSTTYILKKDYIQTTFEWGKCFVEFLFIMGYGSLLKCLGQDLSSFLEMLEYSHEYISFSYKKLKPPSFFCNEENETGLLLHYRSSRLGFVHFVRGQIKKIGLKLYNLKVDSEVLHISESDSSVSAVIRIIFDNSSFKIIQNKFMRFRCMSLSSGFFFDLFPFHIVFNQDMVIINAGKGLYALLPNIFYKTLPQAFITSKMFKLTWNEILIHENAAFQLESQDCIREVSDKLYGSASKTNPKYFLKKVEGCKLHLRGQMLYFKEWQCIVFLCSPIIKSLDSMFKSKMFMHDLNMHDWSRFMILHNFQPIDQLRVSLEAEENKYHSIKDRLKKELRDLNDSEKLLYQMLPPNIATKLRNGEPPLSTCQVFDMVSVMFSDIVGFSTICSRLDAIDVVELLNDINIMFDIISEKHSVFKVQIIGDGYMAISGVPDVATSHTACLCDFALELLKNVGYLKDPATKSSLKIRIGIHSGSTVAGVIGIKLPRYCVFGDVVYMASRMESNSKPMKIHISETTRMELKGLPYLVQERGTVTTQVGTSLALNHIVKLQRKTAAEE